MWLLLACTPEPAEPVDTDTPAKADAPGVGLWVWDDTIPGNPAATSDLLTFSADNGVTTLFVTCDPVGYGLDGADERYAAFVADAHAAGLQVYGMSGYSWFSVPCDAGLDGQETCWEEGWTVLEGCASSGVGFDGIMDDTEPASTPDGSFFVDFEQRAAWYVAYLEGVRERIGGLPLHHAMAAWYDTLDPIVLDGGEAATLDVWVARTVDVVGIMGYRDSAAATLEISASALGNGPAWVGLETGPSGEGEHLTFAEEGAEAVSAAMDEMGASVADNPNFHGFMVDSYETWRGLTR